MSVLALLLALVFSCSASNARSVTVIVDKFGSGNFTNVQQAIDWVPVNNKRWIQIHVKAGTYTEQVTVPANKPYILLEGESRARTIIQSSGHGVVVGTSTFTVSADNFVASRITFQNTYDKLILRDEDAVPNAPMERAPAFMIYGDKASFYRCGFVSLQDTLSDMQGRHYFSGCYIEGAMDFIWGSGQSIYEGCAMYSRKAGTTNYITAQGRESPSSNSGFVFKYCTVNGDSTTFLGRVYRAYSRVVFFKSALGGNVAPQGWFAWDFVGQEDLTTYVEEGCSGPGANKSNRVKWMKKLGPAELIKLVSTRNYINADRWIEAQPHPS